MKIYKCKICGKEYTDGRALAGHTTNHNITKESFLLKLKLGRIKHKKERDTKAIIEYMANPPKCVECGKILPIEKKTGYKFCNSHCSAIHTNKTRVSFKDKTKTLKCSICGINCTAPINIPIMAAKCDSCIMKRNEHTCVICGKTFSHIKYKKTCSAECYTKLNSINSRIVAANMPNRSKNEIHFAELCKTIYKDVLTNMPIFNGWDTDVILTNEKIAILWNGVWHHKKITKKHSLEQTKNRDKMKIREIIYAGYIPYIIDDFGGANPKFVIQEFEKFKITYPPIK